MKRNIFSRMRRLIYLTSHEKKVQLGVAEMTLQDQIYTVLLSRNIPENYKGHLLMDCVSSVKPNHRGLDNAFQFIKEFNLNTPSDLSSEASLRLRLVEQLDIFIANNIDTEQVKTKILVDFIRSLKDGDSALIPASRFFDRALM